MLVFFLLIKSAFKIRVALKKEINIILDSMYEINKFKQELEDLNKNILFEFI